MFGLRRKNKTFVISVALCLNVTDDCIKSVFGTDLMEYKTMYCS